MGEGRAVTPRWGSTTARAPTRRGRPRSFFEWATLRRWGKLPPWEVDQAGYLLRLAREEAGLTQTELAARLGVSQQAVSRAEAWTSNPTVGLLRHWLAACGWSMRIEAEPDG
jgi:DNA-binding XRE family transcriptional regulator